MAISRRSFLWTSLAACTPFFAGAADEAVRIGLLSDIHVGDKKQAEVFRKALEAMRRDITADGKGDFQRLLFREGDILLYQIPDAGAINQFHDNVIDVAFLAYVIDIDDIGMDQVCRDLRLAPEALDKAFVLGIFGSEYFYGHITIEQTVARFEYDSHSAFTDLFDQLISSGQDPASHK